MSVAPTTPRPDQRFLLTGMSWRIYEELLAELKNRRIRVTYDRGDLELMAPSFPHERYGRVLGLLLEVLAEEFGLPFMSCGMTTFRREDLERGLEPDNCFYLRNVEKILGKQEIDLKIDPPPDIAVEIDITSSSLNRMGIYAALGVPEIWRYDGEALDVYKLKHGKYESVDRCATFPAVPLSQLTAFLDDSMDYDDIQHRRRFRDWLREEVMTDEEEK